MGNGISDTDATNKKKTKNKFSVVQFPQSVTSSSSGRKYASLHFTRKTWSLPGPFPFEQNPFVARVGSAPSDSTQTKDPSNVAFGKADGGILLCILHPEHTHSSCHLHILNIFLYHQIFTLLKLLNNNAHFFHTHSNV